MRFFGIFCIVAILCCDLAAAESPLVVIVHRSRHSPISVEEVARIFLKKQRYWKDGAPVVPINREARSASRRVFEQYFLVRVRSDLVAYWNEQYFHGVFPPATLESDEAVKRYVGADSNAIGYIAADLVDDSVRVVHRLD